MPLAHHLRRIKQQDNSGGSLRRQLLLSTVLTQSVLVLGFIALILFWQYRDQDLRAVQRLQLQADLLAQTSALELAQHDIGGLERTMAVERRARSVENAQIVDLQGRAIVDTDPSLVGSDTLGGEHDEILAHPERRAVLGNGLGMIGVSPVTENGRLMAVAVVTPNWKPDHDQTVLLVRLSVLYGLLAILANAIASTLIARSVSRPVMRLLAGTQQVAQGSDISEVFPVAHQTSNEVGRLIDAFNAMAQTLEKQRAGLNDTLSLLDSMLTNAPVGFAFFDRKHRFVRLNQDIADIHGTSVARHLGRPLKEMLLPEFAALAETKVQHVLDTGETLRDVELAGFSSAHDRIRTWLANFFAVRTADGMVRWVGMIVVEVTERRKTEETLRRTEKLAAAGRLAASIAHEINNPLEGVTNLLYLLQHQPLDEVSRKYIEMAQHEVARVSEITQQTLRFYRQSTAPMMSALDELFTSVLSLYQGRLTSSQISVRRRFRVPAEIYGYSGELRQLIANLVGNAMDATPGGGVLYLRTQPSKHWRTGEQGVRVTVADTGCGMDAATRKRIFEPFFTTKEATGTGLGLWVSSEILEKHKAVLQIRSRVGTGTVFYMFFPHDALRNIVNAVSVTAPEAPKQ